MNCLVAFGHFIHTFKISSFKHRPFSVSIWAEKVCRKLFPVLLSRQTLQLKLLVVLFTTFILKKYESDFKTHLDFRFWIYFMYLHRIAVVYLYICMHTNTSLFNDLTQLTVKHFNVSIPRAQFHLAARHRPPQKTSNRTYILNVCHRVLMLSYRRDESFLYCCCIQMCYSCLGGTLQPLSPLSALPCWQA